MYMCALHDLVPPTVWECILKQMVEIKAVRAVGACATIKLA